jgi:hypothetical protein
MFDSFLPAYMVDTFGWVKNIWLMQQQFIKLLDYPFMERNLKKFSQPKMFPRIMCMESTTGA